MLAGRFAGELATAVAGDLDVTVGDVGDVCGFDWMATDSGSALATIFCEGDPESVATWPSAIGDVFNSVISEANAIRRSAFVATTETTS